MNKLILLISLFTSYALFISLTYEKDVPGCERQISLLGLCQPAGARVGDPIASFQTKFSRIFSLKDTSSKDGKTYYRFSLNKDPIQQKEAPGFAGGMTITCGNGKIQGESLVVRLGKNARIGKVFTTGLSMDLTYEAIGKPTVIDKKEAAAEYRSYLNAINEALTGSPQDIKYAGYSPRITLSSTAANDVLLAISINSPSPAQDQDKKNAGKVHR